MRKLLVILSVAAFAAALVPNEADARAGARSGAARFAPRMQGPDMRTMLNRALAQRLHLRCYNGGRAASPAPRWRCG